MPKINPRLAAMLAQPERVVEPRHEVPGLLEDTSPAELSQTAERLIVTHAAGEALKQARQQRALSLRGAGAASGRSAPRIKAMEDTDTDIHLGTVVEHARSLGYAVELTLTPLDGMGAVVRATLGEQGPASSADTLLVQQMGQMQAELVAMRESMTRLTQRLESFDIDFEGRTTVSRVTSRLDRFAPDEYTGAVMTVALTGSIHATGLH